MLLVLTGRNVCYCKMDYLWMFRVVKIEGEGMDASILEFSNQKSGAQGLLVTSDNVTLQDFAVVNAKGDAIKSKGANNISFIRVKTEWTGGPKTTNGAYGLYPVESENILIDDCVAIGASDAGIYVGQSKTLSLKIVLLSIMLLE